MYVESVGHAYVARSYRFIFVRGGYDLCVIAWASDEADLP